MKIRESKEAWTRTNQRLEQRLLLIHVGEKLRNRHSAEVPVMVSMIAEEETSGDPSLQHLDIFGFVI